LINLVKVTKADVAAKHLTIKDGSQISYEKLIIATGATPNRLNVTGSDLQGIFYVREYDENLKLAEAIKASRDKPAVVVGGGYMGLEVAAALVLNGVSVTVVMPSDRVLDRLFTAEIASHYERFYESKGVKFIKGMLRLQQLFHVVLYVLCLFSHLYLLWDIQFICRNRL